IPEFATGDLPWAYMAVLNSDFFERILSFFCPRVGGGQYEVYPKYVDQLPIPDLSTATEQLTSRLACIGRAMATGDQVNDQEVSALVSNAFGVSELEWRRAFPATEQERITLRLSELASRCKKWTLFASCIAK